MYSIVCDNWLHLYHRIYLQQDFLNLLNNLPELGSMAIPQEMIFPNRQSGRIVCLVMEKIFPVYRAPDMVHVFISEDLMKKLHKCFDWSSFYIFKHLFLNSDIAEYSLIIYIFTIVQLNLSLVVLYEKLFLFVIYYLTPTELQY